MCLRELMVTEPMVCESVIFVITGMVLFQDKFQISAWSMQWKSWLDGKSYEF